MGELTLDSVSGRADITAGPGGAGDVSFLVADTIVTSTGGANLAPQVATAGSPVTIADDVGVGGTGTLRFSTVGAGTASVFAVPVIGGGSVVAEVVLASDLTVTATGAGGDVTIINSEAGPIGNVRLTGARDTDLLSLEADGNLGSVRNLTPGGDIFSVGADGTIGTVLTSAGGNIGNIFTGTGNSTPMFPSFLDFAVGGVEAGGNINLIQTGSIVGAYIATPGNITTINTGQGGLVHSDVEVGGNLTRLMGGFAFDSDIWVDGSGTLLSFGALGVSNCDINYVGGLGTANIQGDLSDSDFESLDWTPGGSPFGGMIRNLRARNIAYCDIEAFGGFGSIIVLNQVIESDMDSSWWDPVLAARVGGGINSFRAGGMYESYIDVEGDVRYFRSGTISQDTEIYIGGNLGNALIASDLLDSYFDIEGDLTGRLVVQGDVINDYGEIEIGGNSNTIIINGSLSVGDGISIDGNSNRLIVRGGGTEGSDIYVGGNSNFMFVGFLDDGTEIEIDGDSRALFVGNMDSESGIDIYGSSGILRVPGSMTEDSWIYIEGDSGFLLAGFLDDNSYIEIEGSSRILRVAHSLTEESYIEIDGDSGVLTIGGGSISMENDSYIDISGSSRLLAVRGAMVEDSWIDIYGDSGALRIGSFTESDIWIGGSSDLLHIGRASYGPEISIEGDARRIFMGAGAVGGAIDGDEETLWVGGDLGSLVFGGGLVEYYIDVDGDVTGNSIIFQGSVSEVDIWVGGRLGRLLVNGTWSDGDIEAEGGFGQLFFREQLSDVDITSAHYDQEGLPIGGGLDVLRAAGVDDVYIELHGDLRVMAVSGLISDTEIDLAAYDGWGEGALVGGGGIGLLTGVGIVGCDVTTFGGIDRMFFGSTGIVWNDIQTLDAATGNVGRVFTSGLVVSDIKVAGDLLSVHSGGAAAVPPSAPTPSPIDGSLVDFLFVDPDGVPIGGTLAVDGAILGMVS